MVDKILRFNDFHVMNRFLDNYCMVIEVVSYSTYFDFKDDMIFHCVHIKIDRKDYPSIFVEPTKGDENYGNRQKNGNSDRTNLTKLY